MAGTWGVGGGLGGPARMAEVLQEGVLRHAVVRAVYHFDESQSVAVTSMVSDAKTSDISSCEEIGVQAWVAAAIRAASWGFTRRDRMISLCSRGVALLWPPVMMLRMLL